MAQYDSYSYGLPLQNENACCKLATTVPKSVIVEMVVVIVPNY